MRILVTGGGGVIGAGLAPELLKADHEIVFLSRHAEGEKDCYPKNVTAFPADVTDANSLRGGARGCDAVIHIAGIVEEHPPDLTFEKVNVSGTENMLEEARNAGVQRFVFISSLGADHGKSEYHKSKLQAENRVRESGLNWTIVRSGNVYGPGDEVISTLLKLVRALPVVPVVGWGEQRFQPVWFEDLGKALAVILADTTPKGEILELAGAEVTTTKDILQRLGKITRRSPVPIPVPAAAAGAAARIAESFPSLEKWSDRLGLKIPITTAKLQMLVEENFIREGKSNALPDLLQSPPTPLDAGLGRLADELPELLPDEGFGSMEQKRFEVEIEGSSMNSRERIAAIREKINDIVPIEFKAEPGVPGSIKQGETLTGAIPGRGHFQVRAVEVTPEKITLATLEGHPLAGAVCFRAEDRDNGTLLFQIEVLARASNIFDWIALHSVGRPMQNTNWRETARRVVELSGGSAPDGVNEWSTRLPEEDAARVTREIEEKVKTNSRREQEVDS